MNWARLYLSIILILFLTGCAANPIDFSKAKTVPQEEAVVFGRVNVIYKDEPKVWDSFLYFVAGEVANQWFDPFLVLGLFD